MLRRRHARPAAAEEWRRTENDAETRLPMRKLCRPQYEVETFSARLRGNARNPGLAPRFGSCLPFKAPRGIAYDQVELLQSCRRRQHGLAISITFDRTSVTDEQCPADQWLELQGLRWLRVRVQLKRCQVQAERSDANRGFANVHAIDLPVERRADQFPRGRLTLRAKMNQAPQRFDQENTGAARQIQHRLPSR